MSRTQKSLGICPECDGRLFPGDVLVKYDTANGTEYYVECPGCETVVHPAEE